MEADSVSFLKDNYLRRAFLLASMLVREGHWGSTV